MKRHAKLQDLSREHYAALKLALHAKRAALSGDPGQVERAAMACRAAFANDLEPHFGVEERDLLPLLLAGGQVGLVRRTEQEHALLRRLAEQLQQPAAAVLLEFSESLTAHVRFEEREMFEALEHHFTAN